MNFSVALAGNPNAGKTSIFNALTASRQHVGNWPGVTVEKKEGEFVYSNVKVNVVDLPGTYSLTPYTIDERIARDYIVKERPRLVVVVVDATNLERNFYLVADIFRMSNNVLIVLNMMDLAKKKGIKINVQGLSELLGIPIVETVANRGIGIGTLKKAMSSAADQTVDKHSSIKYFAFDQKLENTLDNLESQLQATDFDYSTRFLAFKLLEKDDEIRALVLNKMEDDFKLHLNSLIIRLEKEYGDDLTTIMASQKYALIHGVCERVVETHSIQKRPDFTDKLDMILIHKYLGIPFFLFILWAVFQFVFYVGGPLVDWTNSFMAGFGKWSSQLLRSWGVSHYIVSFISDGVIGGVGSILVFLPYIILLYFVIGLLEDSGYMARAAFVTDKLMHSIGLHGKSAVPMVLGFGCNVPAILATRTLKSPKDRILTILILPFMSCSARLPIYILFSSVFFPKYAGWVVFSMYVLGILMAVFSAVIFKKTVFKGEVTSLIMELPPYRMPDLKSIMLSVWEKTSLFLRKAGTFIFAAVILVWVLASLPFGVDYASKESLIGRLGTVMVPLLKPLGFGHWQAAVSLLFGFLAKEVVIGTMGTVFGAAGDTLNHILLKFFTPLSAITFMVFTLLYFPCVATVGVIKSEAGDKWALFSVLYMISLAYVVSAAVFNIGSLLF